MSDSNSPTKDHYLGTMSLSVRNLGGINQSEITLKPGVSVFSGRNATNRTSLLSALGGVLGGTTASLKSDTDEGAVSLEIAGETYTRTYERTSTGIQTSGETYTDQDTLVDLCVVLLEDNPARQAVENGDDLREVIMRPVDTDAIEARISEIQQKKHSVETELERVGARQSELPDLKRKRGTLIDEIEALDSELEALRSEVADFEADLDEAEEAAELVDELNNQRQELSATVDKIEVKQAEREALQDEIDDVEAQLDELSSDTKNDVATVDNDLQAAIERRRTLDDTIASLTTIVDFNDDLLSEGTDLPGIETDIGNVASSLAPEAEQEVACWTCGSRVKRGDISEQLEDLRAVINEKREEKEALQAQINELENQKRERKQVKDQREAHKQRLADMQQRIHDREETIEELNSDLEKVKEMIEGLEQEVAETEELRESALLEKYERISDIQYERGQRQQQLDNIKAKIDEIESLPSKDTLESKNRDLQDELERERVRIDELESKAVEAFNEHMDELIDTLEYENIARVWIEKKKTTDRQGGASSQTQFDLHIIRETDEGTGYEDQVENLSESEREVVGIVVALAGYLVHDVYEELPFMLLDSLEAIDAQRIANLIEYFANFVPYLIITLLPEDSSDLQMEHERITADSLAA